ncbi:MAG: hypothetical protein GX080_03130 [Tissierellia bacterium]|nr:hypothetical protein [Tissierellia bacterium]
MKKAKFLLLTLVVAVMLTGAGYAYWKEEAKILTTVNTGKIDIMIHDENVKTFDNLVEGGVGAMGHHGPGMPSGGGGNKPPKDEDSVFTEGVAKVDKKDDNILRVSLYRMYPGSGYEVNFKIKNTGTMDAKLGDLDLYEFDEALGDYLILKEYKVYAYEKVGKGYDWVAKVNKKVDIRLENIESISNTIKGIAIPKDKSVMISFKFEVDRAATEQQIAEMTDYGFNFKINVYQFNEPIR